MPKKSENEDHKILSNTVKFDVDESRMLKLSHLCTSLPVFAADALRDNCNCSVRFLPHNWLLIVAGTELFVWKYACSPSQSQSHCLRFSLPTSEIAHSALLVALLFSHSTSSSSSEGTLGVPLPSGATAPVPTGCLVLSSCGGNLRSWPRLTRDYVYTDHSLSAPIGGLYGDEAMQLEPVHLPGTFVVATRTCHLAVVDARNAQQQAVTSRVLTCDGILAGGGSGLISSLGRRVSTLLTAVTPIAFGGSQHQLYPERGGGNAVFVRLLTLPRLARGNSNATATSYVLLLMKKRLDIWALDSNLKERFVTANLVESLLPESMSHRDWLAVDMATRYPTAVGQTFTSPCLYLLLASSWKSNHLVLVSITFKDDQLTVSQVTNTAHFEWPFQMVIPRQSRFVPGQAETFTDENNNSCSSLRLCLHDSTDMVRCLFGDHHQSQRYPSLLASVYCQSVGQVAIVEVLTGNRIATLDFFQSTNLPTSRNQSQSISSLISVGPGHVTNDPQLFVFLTRQRGLIGLGPSGLLDNTTDFQASAVTTAASSRSSLLLSTPEASSAAGSGLSRLYRSSIRPSQDGSLCDVTLEETHRGIRDHVITVDSTSQGRLQVICQLCDDTCGSAALTVLESVHHLPIELAPADKAFVGFCEVARISWMGFREQAGVYLHCLLVDPSTSVFLPISVIRFAKRLLNEPPMSDPRWHKFLTLGCSGDGIPVPSPEGCFSFQFVILRKMTDSALLLFKHRLKAKLEAVAFLREVLTSLFTPGHGDHYSPLIDLSDVHSYLLAPLLAGVRTKSSSLPPRRQYAGERRVLDDTTDSSTLPFTCTLPEEDGGSSNPEICASQLLTSVDVDRAVQAAEDIPLDQIGYPTRVHVLAGLAMAEELVEFTKAVYVRLARESNVSLQASFRKTATFAGYPTNFLSVVNSQDVVLQTLTLMPSLVIELGEAVSRELNSQAEGPRGDTGLADESQIPELHHTDASIYLLTETARLISAGLTEVVMHRDRLLQSTFNSGSHETLAAGLRGSSLVSLECRTGVTHYLPCWLTDARPYGVGDVLLNLFDQLIACGSGEWIAIHSEDNTPLQQQQQDLVHEAAMLAVEWTSCLLRLSQQRVQWATATSKWAWSPVCATHDAIPEALLAKTRLETVQRLRRLRCWYAGLRERLITAVADRLRLPELALKLAERFSDCQQMVRLCHVLECQSDTVDGITTDAHHSRLAELLSRVPSGYGLAESALQWYLSCGEHARVQSLLSLLASHRGDVQSSGLEKAPSELAYPAEPEPTEWSLGHQTSMSNVHVAASSSIRDDDRVHRGTPTVATVQRFLNRQDTRDHAWSHMFATGQYDIAAGMLLHEGCREKRFLGRRKTLLSLSKLAHLSASAPNDPLLPMEEQYDVASATTACSSDRQISTKSVAMIDLLLEVIKLQEQLPSDIRARMDLDQSGLPDDEKITDHEHQTTSIWHPLKRSHEQVLDPHSLASLYLDCSSLAEGRQTGDDEKATHLQNQLLLSRFLSAIRIVVIVDRVLDQQPDLLGITSQQEWETTKMLNRDLLMHIWCQAIKRDDWHLDDNLDEITAMDVCSSMFVWRLTCSLRAHDTTHGNLLLPELEELLQCEELTELAGSQNFTYLMRSGFEHLKTAVSC